MIQARAITAGLIGPGRAQHLLDLDATHLLAFLEALLCENPKSAEQVQKIYDDARPRAPIVRDEDRRADVLRFMSMAG